MIRRTETDIHLDAESGDVYSVLTDYEHYDGWMPGVLEARVLDREGDIAVVEFTVEGRRMVLELVATPPQAVLFSEVDRYRGKGISGEIRLTPADGGVSIAARMGDHTAALDFRARRRQREWLESAAAGLRRRIGRGPREGASRRKILEVARRGDRLELWTPDGVYQLERKGDGS